MSLDTGATDAHHCCPICGSALGASGRKFSLEELLALWKPVVFSSATIEEHKRQSEYTQLYVCPVCNLGIYLPQIIGTSNFYVDLLKYENVYAYSKEKWEFGEAIKDASGCGSVIEIGCGPGNFLEKLKSVVENVYGTEYNEHALGLARSKGFSVFGIGDRKAEQLKGKCDIAFSFHVLEHVPDTVNFIREMFSWVGIDGKVGISVPNMGGPVRYINPCVSNMPPHHATLWSLQTFEVLAEKCGYKVERFAYEPLLVQQHWYYSNYWFEATFSGNSLLMKVTRSIVSRVLSVFFRVCVLLGKESISWLRGQSIYILLSKK